MRSSRSLLGAVVVAAVFSGCGSSPDGDSDAGVRDVPSTHDASQMQSPDSGGSDARQQCGPGYPCPAGQVCVAVGSGELTGMACQTPDAGSFDVAPMMPDVVDVQAPPPDVATTPDAGPGCPTMTVQFDWGTHASGPCTVTLMNGRTDTWVLTSVSDDYVGGVFAQCNPDGTWQISSEKCAPRGTATTCFPAGTRCDGSGPATFPYEHCWTCCNATDPVPGVCN